MQLADILAIGDKDSTVQFDFDTDTRRLTINIRGLEYNLGMYAPHTIREEPEIPDDMELPNTAELEWTHISKGITAIDMVSDHTEIICGGNGDQYIEMVGEGDTDDATQRVSDFENGTDITEDTTSLFSIEYLKSIDKGIPTDTTVTLVSGDEFPLKVKFSYADGMGHCTYVLAPRISQ
jgi:proliferating cell nuclear antigen